MMPIPGQGLPPATQRELQDLQVEVNAEADYLSRVERAKKEFDRRNKRTNSTFKVVRRTLEQMCCGARRCSYCEDSARQQIDHIWPKDFYPEKVFVWENYLYACGSCNQPKSNQFALFLHGSRHQHILRRRRKDPILPPPPGDPLFINPRIEDPMQFIKLDLFGSFRFVPRHPLGTEEHVRAAYTIEVLALNDRDELVAGRSQAFDAYSDRIVRYISYRDSGQPQERLDKLIAAVSKMNHPTVWSEMKQQRHHLPELDDLFNEAPEALDW